MCDDLINDASEKTDVAAKHPKLVASMKNTLDVWIESCKKSNYGDDYV